MADLLAPEPPLAPVRKPVGHVAVYRLYDVNDRLLYVGITDLLRKRLREHARDKDWWPLVAYRRVAWYAIRRDAVAAEVSAISTEGPVYNIAEWASRTYPDGEPPPIAGDCPALSISAVRHELGDRLDAAHFKGEPTVITRTDRPRAAIVPYAWYEELLRLRGATTVSNDRDDS